MSMKADFKKFAIAALVRAVRTFAQTFIGCISVGAAFSEVQWLKGISISGVAFILSLLTSVATGLPEVPDEPAEEEEANG